MIENHSKIKPVEVGQQQQKKPQMELACWIRKNFILTATIVAVFAGVILGLCIRRTNPSPQAIMLIGFPGEILMQMLKVFLFVIQLQ